jgi:TRAP-type transport system small permease protein
MSAMLDRLCGIGEAIAIAMLLAVTGLILAQIGAREFMNLGLAWADELARYCGLGMIFLVIPVLLRHGWHVKVDYFLHLTPARTQRVLAVANELLTLGFCAAFLFAGYFFMQRAGRFSTPALGMPNLFFYLPAMVGTALMFLVAIARVARALRK